jgi:hypothetical protein
VTAGTEGSPRFRAVDVAADQARQEYEGAFRRYVDAGELGDLRAACEHRRRWLELVDARMMVAYFERYRTFPHTPGAP